MKPKKYRYKGESLTIGEWAKRAGLSPSVLFMRLKHGWSIARALTEPVARHKSRNRRKPRREPASPAEANPTDKTPTATSAAAEGTVHTDAAGHEIPAPQKPKAINRDFLRGMAEGIWLAISSVAMMMAESGEGAAVKNLKRVEEMFKGGFAEQFANVVSERSRRGK